MPPILTRRVAVRRAPLLGPLPIFASSTQLNSVLEQSWGEHKSLTTFCERLFKLMLGDVQLHLLLLACPGNSMVERAKKFPFPSQVRKANSNHLRTMISSLMPTISVTATKTFEKEFLPFSWCMLSASVLEKWIGDNSSKLDKCPGHVVPWHLWGTNPHWKALVHYDFGVCKLILEYAKFVVKEYPKT